MMQTMRHLAQTKVFKGLMMILMISFALWGIGDIFRGNALQRTVAKAGNMSISVQALNQEFEQNLVRIRQSMGSELTAEQAKKMGLLDKTLEGMIERAEVDQAIQKLGIEASPKMVLDQLAAQPQFRDKDGKFNKALFLQLLEQSHMNEKTFVSQGREDLSRRQLVDVLSDTGKTPQSILDTLYKARGQKRIMELVTVKNDSIRNIPAPDDAALRDYYQKNPQPFTAPEYRAITIARLSGDDVLKETVVSEEQVKKEYDTHMDRYVQPERRDVLQVVVQSEDKAKELSASAKKGGNLATAAKAMGYEAVMLPQADQKSMLPELVKPVFALPKDEISDPIKSSLGWHVVQIKKISPAGKSDLKDVQKDIHDTLQKDQAVEAVTKMVNDLDDQLAAGHALEDIADGMKLRIIKIPAVDAQGKTPNGKDPAEFPSKDDVLKTAFAQGAGEVSPIIDDKNGNYIVIRTDDIKASALKPFDQVKDEVANGWKASEQAKRASETAQKIAQGMREGKPASSFAGEAEARNSKPLSLVGDNDTSMPASAMPDVFRLKKGEVAIVPTPDKQIVMRLKETEEAEAGDKDSELKIAEEMKKNSVNELTEQYLRYLHTVFPVKIYEDRLDTIRQQGS